MWAAIRLLRASRVFGIIFLSYLWSLAWSRLWPRRYDTADRWRQRHRRNARRMYRGFVSLRGVYIKLGQILSIMGSFLPKAYTEELEGLQDEVPPRPTAEMARAFEQSLGVPPSKAFASFSAKPIAAASLGQVHEARGAGEGGVRGGPLGIGLRAAALRAAVPSNRKMARRLRNSRPRAIERKTHPLDPCTLGQSSPKPRPFSGHVGAPEVGRGCLLASAAHRGFDDGDRCSGAGGDGMGSIAADLDANFAATTPPTCRSSRRRVQQAASRSRRCPHRSPRRGRGRAGT